MNLVSRIALIALVAFGLMGAKAEVGTAFNEANLLKLEVGKTSLAETIALLGSEPQISTMGGSGAMAYTWQYIESNSSLWTGKSNTQSKLVMLVFNTDGTFQRILQMQGITLDPESHRRLFTAPAATVRPPTS